MMPSPAGPSGDVRFGILMPQYGVTVDDAFAAARAADAAGLDIWIAGQILPRPESPPDSAVLEPLTLMSAVAVSTTRSRLGFMALAAPYIPAYYLARALITLDHISDGRLDIGLGAGWQRQEFNALAIPFETLAKRVTSLEAAIDALEQLSFEPPISSDNDVAHDRFHQLTQSRQQPRPPCWVAGASTQILELAARRAEWANFARGIGLDDFSDATSRLHALAYDNGRAGSVQSSLTATFLGGDDVAEVIARRALERGESTTEYRQRLRKANVFVGSVEEVAEQMSPFVRRGCRAFVLWPLEGDRVRSTHFIADVSHSVEWVS